MNNKKILNGGERFKNDPEMIFLIVWVSLFNKLGILTVGNPKIVWWCRVLKYNRWKELKIFWLTQSYHLIAFKNGLKVLFQGMNSEVYLPGKKRWKQILVWSLASGHGIRGMILTKSTLQRQPTTALVPLWLNNNTHSRASVSSHATNVFKSK